MLSGLEIRVPRDLEERLRIVLEKIIREVYGEAMLSSIKSYLSIESKDYDLVELLLYRPSKLVEYLTTIFSGSKNTAYDFIKNVIEKLYDSLGETPEIDVNNALRRLREGSEEEIQTLILEIAHKLRMKSKKPLF